MTADVERFYAALDEAERSSDPVGVFEREYLGRATVGLRYYHESGRLEDAELLWRTVRSNRERYRAVQEFSRRLPDAYPGLGAVYDFFGAIRPGSTTPSVYFVIGHFQGGATAFEGGLVIALDNWAADWSSFDASESMDAVGDPGEILTQIVAHELVHFHQACTEACGSLLAESIMEGTADFVAELVTGERANRYMRHIHRYYDEHESRVWVDFERDMRGRELAPWLYADPEGDRPQNLGYAIGYRIAKAYYESRGGGRAAIEDLLELEDAEEILAASGYDPG